jgi:ERF superfamily
MKATINPSPPARLENRDGVLCIVMEAPFDSGLPNAGGAALRQWFRLEECDADPALVAGRPVRNVDPANGLFVDEEGNSFRLAGGGGAKPLYSDITPVEGESGTLAAPGTDEAPMAAKQPRVSGDPANGKRRRNGREKRSATADGPPSDAQPGGHELNLREKFAEVRRRLGYVQKRGHNELHNYSYVMAADLAGAVGDILSELGVVMIPQLQSISTETPRSSSERIARIVMNYRFVDTKTGEELTVRVAGEGADPGDKAPYKAMTGALKYALLQSFLLASGDDPEDERGNSRSALASERVITPGQVGELQRLIDETGTELERVLAYYRISALSEMTEASYRRALELLNRKLAKQSQGDGAHAQI